MQYQSTCLPKRSVEHVADDVAAYSDQLRDQRVALLERRAPRIVERARQNGVEVTYLGIAPLFDGARAFAGPDTDWLLWPNTNSDQAVMPFLEREKLIRLTESGIDFPMTYVAHEVPKGRLALSVKGSSTDVATLQPAVAREIVGPTPMSVAGFQTSQELARHASRVLAGLRSAARTAGTLAAAPFVAAGAVLGGLDPIVFGVVPAGGRRPNEPAAWYVLARWEW
jgi:hypothetical protein